MKTLCYRRKSDGRYIVRHPSGYMYVAATCTLPTIFRSGYHGFSAKIPNIKGVDKAVNDRELEFEYLDDVKWIHPHLPKAIKKSLKIL